MTHPAVAVVITCYDLGRTLEEAVESVVRQTLPAAEVLVVDDGSTDLYTLQVLARLAGAGHRVHHTANRGVSAARNLGIRLTTAPYIVLLDADDRLAPTYLEKAAAHLEAHPELAFVSCAMRSFEGGSGVWAPPSPDLVESMTRGVVHISSMFRRRMWEAVGGFDEDVRAFEELDFWTTVLERGYRGEVLQEPLLDYRVRPASMYHSAIRRETHLSLMERFYRKHWSTIETRREDVLRAKERFILDQHTHQENLLRHQAQLEQELEALNRRIGEVTRDLQAMGSDRVDWGELRRTSPLSPVWGLDRGRPLDRYYIEGFLDRHRKDIRGRVLEIKDPGYTRLFGDDRVGVSDVLDVDPRNERATIVADLTRAEGVPDDTYDCFILTQTLVLIYDVRAALAHAFRVLKPGGVLLCTVGALGRISYEDRGVDGDYWRFTEASLRELFASVFPLDAFEVTVFGNVLAGVAFLYGLAAHELSPVELDELDPAFPLVYGVRAVKPIGGGGDGHVAEARRAPTVRRDSAQAARGVVLMYHRVAEHTSDAHGLCVTPQHFEQHIEHVRRYLRPTPLVELARAVWAGDIDENAVAITMDDGYLDSLEPAAAILQSAGVPATVFVTGEGLDGPHEFWWDWLERVLMGPHGLPSRLALRVSGQSVELPTSTAEERETSLRRLTDLFYPLPREARDEALDTIVHWSGLALAPRNTHRALTADEVARLAVIPGLTIGAHTSHHLCLPAHAEDVQRREIRENKERLQAIVGRPVTAFAYPYGEYSEATRRVVAEAGFEVAVTVREACATRGCDPLLVPRFEVKGWEENDFAARVRLMLTATRAGR